jgi:hypothetical protein
LLGFVLCSLTLENGVGAETNITPDRELFKRMVITPMETMKRAVAQFMTDASRTGEVAELHGDSITMRPHADYADADVAHNNKMFWELGHA